MPRSTKTASAPVSQSNSKRYALIEALTADIERDTLDKFMALLRQSEVSTPKIEQIFETFKSTLSNNVYSYGTEVVKAKKPRAPRQPTERTLFSETMNPVTRGLNASEKAKEIKTLFDKYTLCREVYDFMGEHIPKIEEGSPLAPLKSLEKFQILDIAHQMGTNELTENILTDAVSLYTDPLFTPTIFARPEVTKKTKAASGTTKPSPLLTVETAPAPVAVEVAPVALSPIPSSDSESDADADADAEVDEESDKEEEIVQPVMSDAESDEEPPQPIVVRTKGKPAGNKSK